MGVFQTIVSIAAGIVTVILALPIIVKAAFDFIKGIKANNKLSFPKLSLPSSGIITNFLLLLILSLTLTSLVLRFVAPSQQVSNPQPTTTRVTSSNLTVTPGDTSATPIAVYSNKDNPILPLIIPCVSPCNDNINLTFAKFGYDKLVKHFVITFSVTNKVGVNCVDVSFDINFQVTEGIKNEQNADIGPFAIDQTLEKVVNVDSFQPNVPYDMYTRINLRCNNNIIGSNVYKTYSFLFQ